MSIQFAIDGTLGADPSPSLYANHFALLVGEVSTLPVELVGAVIGMAEGLVLALPLAAVFGVLRKEG